MAISVPFGSAVKAEVFNASAHKVIPPGVYQKNTTCLTRNSASSVVVNSGTRFYVQSSGASELSVNAVMAIDSTSISVSSTNCFVVARFAWTGNAGDDVTFTAVPYVSILATDVIIGKCQYVGGSLQTTFDYSLQTRAASQLDTDRDRLVVYPHTTDNTKVIVKAG